MTGKLFLAAAAILAMSGAAFADQNAGQVIYTDQANDGSDLDAKPMQNRLKAPDVSRLEANGKLKTGYLPGGRRGAAPGARKSGTNPDASGRAFGSFGIPYTATRVQDFGTNAAGTTNENYLSTTWPYSAVGKLTFKTPAGASFCSASVIRRSVIVTAAHCYQNFGSNNNVFTNFVFRPAHFGKTGATTNQIQPFGSYKVGAVARAATWANGTDTGSGSARNNDVAIFVLKKTNGEFIGDLTGYFGYSWNNQGFTSSTITGGKVVAAVSTLGYPALMDKGRIMQRADGPSYTTTVGGAAQYAQGNSFTGGSSGGPWVLNFGAIGPVLSGGAVLGSEPFLAVTGVTSWGSADPNTPKDNFSSQFGQNTQFPNADYGGFGPGNIGALLESACSNTAPEGGTFAANGYCD